MKDIKLPFVPAPNEGIDWDGIVKTFPWAETLTATPQNPDYHAEGDVGIHTRMVLEALAGRDEWKKLPKTDRAILFWAALLHDVAKPACTRIKPDGSIHSPSHTVVGERMAREIMYKGIPDPVPLPQREKIAKLVRFHGLPRWLVDQSKPVKKLIRAGLQTRLDHLALLAEADARGRICDDMADGLDRVDFFRRLAAEIGCYDEPYPFETGLARTTYLNSNSADASPAYVPYDTTWGEVILMSGLPGAGKDTWIRSNAAHLSKISLDGIRNELGIGPEQNQGRVIQTAKSRAKAFLREKIPFVWNATNVTSQLRKPLIDLFRSYGARVRIVYVETPYHDLMQRNRTRKASIPPEVIHRLIRKLDIPSIIEAEEVVLDS